jgi:hypothetical protein
LSVIQLVERLSSQSWIQASTLASLLELALLMQPFFAVERILLAPIEPGSNGWLHQTNV